MTVECSIITFIYSITTELGLYIMLLITVECPMITFIYSITAELGLYICFSLQ